MPIIKTQNFRHFDQIAETQTISSFRNSLNTSNDFRHVFHSVIHIFTQIHNEDYEIMISTTCWNTTHHHVWYLTTLMYTLFYHVEILHIIMYNIQQNDVYPPVSQNTEFRPSRPTKNMICMCQKIKYPKTTCFMKLFHAHGPKGGVIRKWCHY